MNAVFRANAYSVCEKPPNVLPSQVSGGNLPMISAATSLDNIHAREAAALTVGRFLASPIELFLRRLSRERAGHTDAIRNEDPHGS
jgi:hypothetical protein